MRIRVLRLPNEFPKKKMPNLRRDLFPGPQCFWCWTPNHQFKIDGLVISIHFLSKALVDHASDSQPFISGWPWGFAGVLRCGICAWISRRSWLCWCSLVVFDPVSRFFQKQAGKVACFSPNSFSYRGSYLLQLWKWLIPFLAVWGLCWYMFFLWKGKNTLRSIEDFFSPGEK